MTPDWQNPITPFFWILGGTIILFLLLGFIIIYIRKNLQRMEMEVKQKHALELQHQQELLETSVKIQENERARIAANIHDDLIGQLHRIKLWNQNEQMNSLLNNSIKTARIISHDLIPPLLEELPLKNLIEDFLQPFEEKYRVSLKWGREDLTATQKLHLFRLLQEVLTNIEKHAAATSVEVIFRQSSNSISLRIRDDGKGINAKAINGLGMKTIELRSQILNADYRLTNRKVGGTSFLLVINKKNEQTNGKEDSNRIGR